MSLPIYREPVPAQLESSVTSLTDDRAADGKSLRNPSSRPSFLGTAKSDPSLSNWYDSYPEEFDNSNNAFDFHVYHKGPDEKEHARKLHQRIRLEFPELRAYKFWEIPVGPHPIPMFEINTFTPAQFGALFGFLVAYRGNLSVLIHPNTDDVLADHTTKATWMGEKIPLITNILVH